MKTTEQKQPFLKKVKVQGAGDFYYTRTRGGTWYWIVSVRSALRISWAIETVIQKMLQGIGVIEIDDAIVEEGSVLLEYIPKFIPPIGVRRIIGEVLKHRERHSLETVHTAERLWDIPAENWVYPEKLAELTKEDNMVAVSDNAATVANKTEEMNMESNIIDGQNKEMNMEITVFNFKAHEVRTVIRDGEPWFVAKDVCEVLGLTNARESISSLDADEKITVSNPDGNPRVGNPLTFNAVSESGLYALIFKSRKPEAKAFRKWVTSEVLPAIRRSGGYIAARAEETPEEILARALIVAKETIDRVGRENQKLQAENEGMKPKALFADAVSSSRTSILIGELAKLLKQNGIEIGQNRLFSWLRKNGWLITRKGEDYNMPTQKGMESELFEIKERIVGNPDGSVRIVKTTKVTGKGQVFFVNKFLQRSAWS